MNDYQRLVYDRLASFLTRFLPKEGRVGYSNQFVTNQLRESVMASRAVSSDGTISPSRVARAMARNGVVMPDSLDEDSYESVEEGGSP